MKILSLIWEYRFMIITFLAVIFYCLSNWREAKSRLYNLMLQAKRQAKDNILKSGQEQEDFVVNLALQKLPASWRLFLGEDTIRKIVKWLFDKSKDILDNGKVDDSYSEVIGEPGIKDKQ